MATQRATTFWLSIALILNTILFLLFGSLPQSQVAAATVVTTRFATATPPAKTPTPVARKPGSRAPASVYTVNTLADSNNGSCGTPCSLRDAINAANATAGADTIHFSLSGTITLASTLPAISDDLTIDGSSQNITISGNNTVQVMIVNGGISVTLNALTIANGTCNCYGAGVVNSGTLNVTNSTVKDNTGSFGGGIFNYGTLNVTNSTLSGNRAAYPGGGGGGIENLGTLTMLNSTLSNNVSDNGISYGSGGGLQVERGAATLANVTIANNSANGAGDDGGGGVMVYGGTVNIMDSTIAGNTTASPTGAAGVSVDQVTAAAYATLKNTIVQSIGKDCTTTNGGALTANSYNLANDNTCDSATTSASINLSALANNGGSTQTMALQNNSSAIDQGDATTCAAAPVSGFDQRGQARNDLQCDVGAFELVVTDSNSTAFSPSMSALTTYGPPRVGIQRLGTTQPGVITATKVSNWTGGTLGAWWDLSVPTSTGLNLTLELCYSSAEMGNFAENSNSHFWRYSGGTWFDMGAVATFSGSSPNRCAKISGVTDLSRWTLATQSPGSSLPTAVTLSSIQATAVDNSALWILVVLDVGLVGGAVVAWKRESK